MKTPSVAELVKQADGRISIMPGAGVRAGNIKMLMEITGATEFHTSARRNVPNPMRFANPLVSDAGNLYVADEAELQKIMAMLKGGIYEVLSQSPENRFPNIRRDVVKPCPQQSDRAFLSDRKSAPLIKLFEALNPLVVIWIFS